jgi:ribosomal protein S18 acetylase RimI-like enzyme
MGQCVADSTLLDDLANDHPPQSTSYTKAIEDNLAAYWLRMGMIPKGEVYSSADLRWEYSGSPFLNRVVESHLDQETADHSIELVKRTFRQRRAAVTWLVGPGGTPADLGTRLTKHGFSRYEDWIGMAMPLNAIVPVSPAPTGLTLTDVDSEPLRNDWVGVVGRSFRFPRTARQRLRQTLNFDATRSVETACEIYHILAYLDDEPASACSLFIKDGVAGIYLVSTVPEHRGNGLGSYMTRVALERAQKLGCRLAVLQSTPQAQLMYESIGFSRCCEIEVFRYDLSGSLWKRIARHAIRASRRLIASAYSSRRRALQETDRDVVTDERPAPSHAH